MQARNGFIACAAWLIACAGSSTGNPVGGKEGVPAGVKVVRSDLARDEKPALASDDAKNFGASNAQFAFELYAELASAQKPGDNLFISPFSISTALAMTYAGAAGKTATEMRDTLHFDLDPSALHPAFNATLLALAGRANELEDGSKGQGFELSIVNQAWGQTGYMFVDSYLDVLARNYGAGMFLVDFTQAQKARKLINDWVLDQTKQRIADLLPGDAIDSRTRLVLTNAIYFKANWLNQFDPKLTKDGTFKADAGDRTVPMMHQVLKANYTKTDSYQAVQLPYLSQSVQMLLILPAQGKLSEVIKGFTSDSFANLRSQLGERETTLTLPKFGFESENALKTPLSNLGMPIAFASGSADFSGMTNSRALYITAIYHKAFVAMDELGTEAAAATAVILGTKSTGKPQSATITFDRPFIFLIYDEPTGQILFLGHLNDPGM